MLETSQAFFCLDFQGNFIDPLSCSIFCKKMGKMLKFNEFIEAFDLITSFSIIIYIIVYFIRSI